MRSARTRTAVSGNRRPPCNHSPAAPRIVCGLLPGQRMVFGPPKGLISPSNLKQKTLELKTPELKTPEQKTLKQKILELKGQPVHRMKSMLQPLDALWRPGQGEVREAFLASTSKHCLLNSQLNFKSRSPMASYPRTKLFQELQTGASTRRKRSGWLKISAKPVKGFAS